MLVTCNRSLGRIVIAAAATLATGLVTSALPEPTPIDPRLPLMVLLIAILGWSAGPLEASIQALFPILVFLAAVPAERPRLIGYGVLLGLAAVTAVAGLVRSEPSSQRSARWIAVVVVLAVTLRAVPVESTTFVALALLLAGLALLAFLFEGEQVPWHVLPVILAIGLVTPLVPARVSLFPLILACLLLFVRRGSFIALAAAAILGMVAGRWAMLLVMIIAVPVLIGAKPLTPVPSARRGAWNWVLVPSWWPIAVRFIAFAPSAAMDAYTSPRTLSIPAVLLVVISMGMRPAVASVYLTAALVILLPLESSPVRQRLAVASATFAAMWLVLFSWSGALAPAFPLPAPLPVVVGLSVLLTLSIVAHPSWLGGAITAALFVMLVVMRPPADRQTQLIGEALRPGESMQISPERQTPTLFLVVSGANVSALRPGSSLGSVELIDRTGRGYRREIALGEVADWGAFRREHFFSTQNIIPAGTPFISGYGSAAFLAGWSRLPLKLEGPIASLRVTASPSLPPNATLQLHQLELPSR